MIFGSPPTFFPALRIAARSTTSGTPVKSCKTMRATTNGISSFAGLFAFPFASASPSLRRAFFPSQLRKTDSSTIRILTGSREIFPISCSSNAGNEYSQPSSPLPASNFFSVLNSSVIPNEAKRNRGIPWQYPRCCSGVSRLRSTGQWSFQLREFRFDLIEVRQLAGVVIAFGVLDQAVLIDDECGAFRHARHAEVFLRQKRIIGNAVIARDLVLIIAQQRHADLLLLRPRFLREGIVAADPVDDSVHAFVIRQLRGQTAHFFRASAGECHRKKQQHRVFLPEIVAQPDLLRAVGGFGGQGEIGSFGSNCKWHKQSSGLS